MPISLYWVNVNDSETAVSIYRSTTPIDEAAPGDPITVIRDGSTKYTDPVPQSGESFYYRIAVTSALGTVFNDNKLIKCIPDLGPGGSEILYGNVQFGYMGSVAIGDIGIPPSSWGSNAGRYHKFIHGGRIIYAAEPGTALSSVKGIIDKKIFTTGIESYNATATTRKWGETFEYENRRFAPRVPKFFDYENKYVLASDYGNTAKSPSPFGRSEMIDLLSAFTLLTTKSQTSVKRIIGLNSYNNTSSSAGCISCDFTANTATAAYMIVNAYKPFDVYSTISSQANVTSNSGLLLPVIEYLGEK